MQLFSGLLVLSLMAFAPAARAADLLTVGEVEKVAGLGPLQSVPKDPAKGAGGDFNFATAAGKLIAIVMVQPKSTFDFWNKQYAKSGEPVAGLGDEAFRTKAGAFPTYVVFRKGDTGVWIQSMGFKAGGATFSPAQLTELAKLAAARL